MKKPSYLITISGDPGAGKGTVAELLGKKYHLPVYSIGDLRRAAAHRRGMTLAEYNVYGEKHPATDREPDRWAAREARRTGRGIFEGRMMFHFIPNSIKIFLSCSLREGARRILHDPHEKRKREADHATLAKTVRSIRRRVRSDDFRYRQYYGVSYLDKKRYDLVVSTTKRTPLEILRLIDRFVTKKAKMAKVSQGGGKVGRRAKEGPLRA